MDTGRRRAVRTDSGRGAAEGPGRAGPGRALHRADRALPRYTSPPARRPPTSGIALVPLAAACGHLCTEAGRCRRPIGRPGGAGARENTRSSAAAAAAAAAF